MVAALLPVTIVSAVPQVSVSSTNEAFASNIKLATNSPSVLISDSKTSQIKPGESKIEREDREKAEAQAKAQAEANSRNTVSRESRRIYNDPSNFDEIYSRAGQAYGVDPRLIKAVHTVETGASGSTSRSSYAGAQGPMQFLPSTWRRHGVDGNGDGNADITNVEDAIFSAAKYLKDCGYPDVRKALWGYNPSSSYYNKVMGVAHSLGY